MAITVDDLHSIAKELSDSSSEVKVRASLGRSYYCGYHLGLDFLGIKDTREWVGGNGGVHQKLIDELMYGGNKPAAYILQALKSKRHLADYKLSASVYQEDAIASLKSLENLIDKFK